MKFLYSLACGLLVMPIIESNFEPTMAGLGFFLGSLASYLSLGAMEFIKSTMVSSESQKVKANIEEEVEIHLRNNVKQQTEDTRI